ncbi:MAG: mandelate racemase/muconate lactonizing enzyme family protein, partial [Chloroflexota bacterium]|nr:mandelate racemase/muconate lactonizing enzyme family protein [Chloroflexota bacterium]
MRISSVEAAVLQWPAASRDYWVSLSPIGPVTELLVRVRTDSGLVGIGEGHGSGLVVSTPAGKRASGAALAVRDLMAPLLKGEDPLDSERLWEKMFGLTYKRGWRQAGHTREAILTALASVDMALWDIKGKAAGMPVWKLLGGYRKQVPAYVTGGYYREGKTIQELQEECQRFVSWGFKGIKIKVAGAPLEEDVKRVEAVRQAIGPNVDLMLDANEGYDVPTAIRAARAYEPFGIRWYEEPVHWYDNVEGLRRVAESTRIPIASGETDRLTRWQCRDMALRGGITLMQYDCTRAGGPTEWLRV